MTAPRATGIPSEWMPAASSTSPAHAAITTLLITATIPAAVRVIRRTRLGDDDEIRLELRREPQVKAAQERDPLCVGEVLDRGLNQTQERHDPHERQHRQQNQRERIERRAEPGHLADEGKRDQVAGQGGEVDAGASVGFGDGERAGGLQVEVLGGHERGRGP